jgi:hypothetical protein
LATGSANNPQLTGPGASGLTVFFLGGMTFYAIVCLYFMVWRMTLTRSTEDWGPAIILIVSAWGIPVVGCIVAVIRDWIASWSLVDHSYCVDCCLYRTVDLRERLAGDADPMIGGWSMIEELLRKGILSLFGLSVLAGIYLVQRFLLFLARRVLPVREAEVQSARDIKSRKHLTFGLRVKRVLLCSLGGMLLGAVAGSGRWLYYLLDWT